jgi:hypothetical protein
MILLLAFEIGPWATVRSQELRKTVGWAAFGPAPQSGVGLVDATIVGLQATAGLDGRKRWEG